MVSGQDTQTSVIREFCRITAVSSPWSLVTAAADPGLALVSAGPLAGQEPPEVNKTTKILVDYLDTNILLSESKLKTHLDVYPCPLI